MTSPEEKLDTALRELPPLDRAAALVVSLNSRRAMRARCCADVDLGGGANGALLATGRPCARALAFAGDDRRDRSTAALNGLKDLDIADARFTA